jgi:hypothetical protein
MSRLSFPRDADTALHSIHREMNTLRRSIPQRIPKPRLFAQRLRILEIVQPRREYLDQQSLVSQILRAIVKLFSINHPDSGISLSGIWEQSAAGPKY